MDTDEPKILTLLSGGLDSTVLLYYAMSISKPGNVRAIAFDYGQRHLRELQAARRIASINTIVCEEANIYHLRRLIAVGSQTGTDAVPDGHYTDESMKTTIVPNRNAIMLSIAVGHAIAIGFDTVMFAAHAGDHAIYPDCREGFVDLFAKTMLEANAWNPVWVRAPFVRQTKTGIVLIGADLNVPFGLTWSCYKGGDIHCGTCGTCVERREAFQLAGVEDPTTYAV